MNRLHRRHRRKGQTITEYVLIIAVVVVAAIGILAMFSDTVREKIGGIITVFDPSKASDVDQETGEGSEQQFRDLGAGGSN